MSKSSEKPEAHPTRAEMLSQLTSRVKHSLEPATRFVLGKSIVVDGGLLTMATSLSTLLTTQLVTELRVPDQSSTETTIVVLELNASRALVGYTISSDGQIGRTYPILEPGDALLRSGGRWVVFEDHSGKIILKNILTHQKIDITDAFTDSQFDLIQIIDNQKQAVLVFRNLQIGGTQFKLIGSGGEVVLDVTSNTEVGWLGVVSIDGNPAVMGRRPSERQISNLGENRVVFQTANSRYEISIPGQEIYSFLAEQNGEILLLTTSYDRNYNPTYQVIKLDLNVEKPAELLLDLGSDHGINLRTVQFIDGYIYYVRVEPDASLDQLNMIFSRVNLSDGETDNIVLGQSSYIEEFTKTGTLIVSDISTGDVLEISFDTASPTVLSQLSVRQHLVLDTFTNHIQKQSLDEISLTGLCLLLWALLIIRLIAKSKNNRHQPS